RLPHLATSGSAEHRHHARVPLRRLGMTNVLVVREATDLTLETFEQIAFDRRRITLDAGLLARLDATRQRLVARLGSGPVYGVNTGMGYLSGISLSASDQAVHQRNLLLGRAV